MYVYCANNGVVGVSAKDGAMLWETTDWKISIATVPSPLVLDGGRIFSQRRLQRRQPDAAAAQGRRPLGAAAPSSSWSRKSSAPRSTRRFFMDNHLYGVRADGKFVCLTLEGKPVWTSGSGQQFGLGPFILADGLILAMNDCGPAAPHRGDAGRNTRCWLRRRS